MALARLERGETLRAINLGTGRGYSVREILEAARGARQGGKTHDRPA